MTLVRVSLRGQYPGLGVGGREEITALREACCCPYRAPMVISAAEEGHAQTRAMCSVYTRTSLEGNKKGGASETLRTYLGG